MHAKCMAYCNTHKCRELAPHGRGTYTYASGEAETGRYAADADVGEGAKWSADRQSAWRLRDGKVVESISLEASIGLPVPPASGLQACSDSTAIVTLPWPWSMGMARGLAMDMSDETYERDG